MMKNSLLSAGVLISLLLSSGSLAYQLSKNLKPASKFEKYKVPANLTELQHKLELADVATIQNMWLMQNGIGIGSVWGMDEDGHVGIRVLVSEKSLPSNYDKRKETMRNAALGATAALMAQFEKNEISVNDITVEFRNTENMGLDEGKTYAIFSNGKLAFH